MLKGKIHKDKKGNWVVTYTNANGKSRECVSLGAFAWRNFDPKIENQDCEIEEAGGKPDRVLVNGVELPKEGGRKVAIANDGQTANAVAVQSFSLKDNWLPKDSREIDYPYIDNFALRLNKTGAFFLPKQAELKDSKVHLGQCSGFARWDAYSDEPGNRQIKAIRDSGLNVYETRASLLWRFVPGFGVASVAETGLSLHQIYGVPYLPASSFKGVCRSYAISRYFDRNEDLAVLDAGFRALFGYGADGKDDAESKSGSALFFDAFTQGKLRLEIDVLTPHYSKYYADATGKIAPGDYFKPVPNKFLTVAPNTQFLFVVACERPDETINEGIWRGQLIGTVLKQLVQEAIGHTAFGAKGATGYGWFKLI